MAHRIKPEDLEDYIKFIAVNRGCPVESVDRNKAGTLELYHDQDTCVHWVTPWGGEGRKGG